MRPWRPDRASVSRRFTRSNDVEEAAAGTVPMQARAIAMARWVFARSGAADEDHVALVSEEVAAGECRGRASR